MAGHTIALYLQEKGHEVCGFDISRSQYIESVVGDARDTDTLKKIITKGKYDSVINCVGILNQFAEQNKSLASFLNSYLPHFLADITLEMDTQIIHMSTDCVFSGKRGEYTERDFRDGETFYDRSKALGELEDKKKCNTEKFNCWSGYKSPRNWTIELVYATKRRDQWVYKIYVDWANNASIS